MEKIFEHAQFAVDGFASAGLSVVFCPAGLLADAHIGDARVWFILGVGACWNDTGHYVDLTCGHPWRPGVTRDVARAAPWLPAVPVDLSAAAGWSLAHRRDAVLAASWSFSASADLAERLLWGRASAADVDLFVAWRRSSSADYIPAMPWARSMAADVAMVAFWSRCASIDLGVVLPWGKSAAADKTSLTPWSRSRQADFVAGAQYTRGFGNIRSVDTPVWIGLPWLASRGAIMINQVSTLKRVSDAVEVGISSFSMSTDRRSWGWNFSAVINTREDLGLLRPVGGPVEVELTVNGYVWRFMIEETSEDYRFSDAGYSVSGRSAACLLSAPYSPLQTKQYADQIQAQQIAAGELSDTGWALSWQISDWTVPGGVFSVSGKDKMQIISQVAAAAGAMVRDRGGSTVTDGWENVLSIVPAYKRVPHSFSDEDPDEYVLAGVIMAEDVGWDPKPGYNYVFVCGETADGVIVRLSWDGTKTVPAPDVTDRLLCDTMAAKNRGIYELCRESFDQTRYSLTLPVPESDSGMRPKLLLPGDIVSVSDNYETFYGIVDAVSVAGVDSVGVVQRVEIERHHL